MVHVGFHPMSHIPTVWQVLNIVKIGTISPTCHLDHFDDIEKKPFVDEASNNKRLKMCQIFLPIRSQASTY